MLIRRTGFDYFGDKAFAGGGGGGPEEPKGRAFVDLVSKSIPPAGYTYIDFDPTPKFDTLGELSTTAYTASSAGYYQIHLVFELFSTVDPDPVAWTLEVLENDSVIIGSQFIPKPDSFPIAFVDFSILANLDQGDYVRGRVSYDGPSTTQLNAVSKRAYAEFFKL